MVQSTFQGQEQKQPSEREEPERERCKGQTVAKHIEMGSEKGKIFLEARTLKSGDGSREEDYYRLGTGQENGGKMDEQGLQKGTRGAAATCGIRWYQRRRGKGPAGCESAFPSEGMPQFYGH